MLRSVKHQIIDCLLFGLHWGTFSQSRQSVIYRHESDYTLSLVYTAHNVLLSIATQEMKVGARTCMPLPEKWRCKLALQVLSSEQYTVTSVEGLEKQKEMGRGCYGAVYEVRLHGLPCMHCQAPPRYSCWERERGMSE